MVKIQTTYQRKKKAPPPKEELLSLLPRLCLREIGEFYGVSRSTAHRWVSNFPEAKDLRDKRVFVCFRCSASFTGPKAKWQYGGHLRQHCGELKQK